MESVALIIGIGTGILSVLTFLGGTYAYIKSSSTKKYASEREIGHLKKSLEQMSTNFMFLDKEFDRRFDLIELKLLEINSNVQRISDKNKDSKD